MKAQQNFNSSFQFLVNPRVGEIFLECAIGSQAGWGFYSSPYLFSNNERSTKNCSCQICQGVKARGYHFDSFQHPFCWSSMLLRHYVPVKVMGEQRIMCFRINLKGFRKCIFCILTSFGRLTLYPWKAYIWKREKVRDD